MGLEVKLQVFEGPLDLLLHLIDKNKIDIYDIPISTITEQYLDYIRRMHEEDMDVASEFLVMAATLLDIKCRMLLPKEISETGEEEDPRAELVEKLLEYKMYKYMSYELRDRLEHAAGRMYRTKRLPGEVATYDPPPDLATLIGDRNLASLNEIFQSLLRRQENKIDPIRSRFGTIEREDVDLDEKTLYIRAYIRKHRQFHFRQLLERQGSRSEIIVAFLVILEEMKTGAIRIEQKETFGDILIVRTEQTARPASETG